MSPPRILIIGAGSRGDSYAHAIQKLRKQDKDEGGLEAIVAAVAEPVDFKRQLFAQRYIEGWDGSNPPAGSCFKDWNDFIAFENQRRAKLAAGEDVPPGVDAVFVCVQDRLHRRVVEALAPLGLHIMCEKPLATSLDDCLAILKALRRAPERVFGIGHVLRYSPHNKALRKLLLEDKVIGDIVSVVHTEPIGYWHFAHSYVRGNWRRSDTSAPTLLTKCCHDIDVLLWLMCSPPTLKDPNAKPHLPSTVSSTGALQHYRRSRKPVEAGDATNCLKCPIESKCKFSARTVYVEKNLKVGELKWPGNIVVPEIEDHPELEKKEELLVAKLAEDYEVGVTPAEEIAGRNWFGRCVYESDNNVCDQQIVTITWDEDPLPTSAPAVDGISNGLSNRIHDPLGGRGAKTATFHMVAQTEKICERYSHFYGTDGELTADSTVIKYTDFNTGAVTEDRPELENSKGHGGGDIGLTRQFIMAVDNVKNNGWTVDKAQRENIACTLEECIRSHALVFAAEEARTGKKIIDWDEWWGKQVESLVG